MSWQAGGTNYDGGYSKGPQPMQYGREAPSKVFNGNNWLTTGTRPSDREVTQDHMDALERFFGRPLKPEKLNVYNGYPIETSDLQEAYTGNNTYLRHLIITRIETSKQWPLRICPWQRKEDGMIVQWDEWKFEDALLDPVPEEAPASLVVSTRSSQRVGITRRAKAFQLEVGFYKSPDGDIQYAANIKQIENAIIETACFDIVHSLLSHKLFRDPFTHFRQRHAQDKNLVAKMFRKETGMWAKIDKDPKGAQMVLEQMQKEAGLRGVGPLDTVIMHGNVTKHLAHLPSKFYLNGNGDDGSELPSNLKYFPSRPFTVGDGEAVYDPIESDQTIGEFFPMDDEHLQNVPPNELTTAMHAYDYYTEEDDKMVRMHYTTAAFNCGFWTWDEAAKHKHTYPITSMGADALKDVKTWGQQYQESGRLKAFITTLLGRERRTQADFMDRFGTERTDLTSVAQSNIASTRFEGVGRFLGAGGDSSRKRTTTTLRRDAHPSTTDSNDVDAPLLARTSRARGADGQPIFTGASRTVDTSAFNLFQNVDELSTKQKLMDAWVVEITSIVADTKYAGCRPTFANTDAVLVSLVKYVPVDEFKRLLVALKANIVATLDAMLDRARTLSAPDKSSLFATATAPSLVIEAYAKRFVESDYVGRVNGNATLAAWVDAKDQPFRDASVASYFATHSNCNIKLIGVNGVAPGATVADHWNQICAAITSNDALRSRLLYTYLLTRLSDAAVDHAALLAEWKAAKIPKANMQSMTEHNGSVMVRYLNNRQAELMFEAPSWIHRNASAVLNDTKFKSDVELVAFLKEVAAVPQTTALYNVYVNATATTVLPTVSFSELSNTLNKAAITEADKLLHVVFGKAAAAQKQAYTENSQLFRDFTACVVSKSIPQLKMVLSVASSLYQAVPQTEQLNALNAWFQLVYSECINPAAWDTTSSVDQLVGRYENDLSAYSNFLTGRFSAANSTNGRTFTQSMDASVPDVNFTKQDRDLEVDVLFKNMFDANPGSKFWQNLDEYSRNHHSLTRSKVIAICIAHFEQRKATDRITAEEAILIGARKAMWFLDTVYLKELQAASSRFDANEGDASQPNHPLDTAMLAKRNQVSLAVRSALKLPDELSLDDRRRLLIQVVYEVLYAMNATAALGHSSTAPAVVYNLIKQLSITKSGKTSQVFAPENVSSYTRDVMQHLHNNGCMFAWAASSTPAAAAAATNAMDTTSTIPIAPLLTAELIKRVLNHTSILSGALWKWAMENNMPQPYGFHIWRPHMTWTMATMIMCKGSGNTGRTFYGHNNFMVTTNVALGTFYGVFTMYSKCVIFEPRNIVHAPNSIVIDYKGGCGDSIWNPNSTDDVLAYHTGVMEHDVFVTVHPMNFKSTNSFRDITGTLHQQLRGDSKLDKEMHYPYCHVYAKRWKWVNTKNPFKWDFGAQEQNKKCNTLCFLGYHRKYSHATKSYSEHVEGKGHWGPYTYPGCAEARRGDACMEKPQWCATGAVRLM